MKINISIHVPEVFDPDSDEATVAIRSVEQKLSELEYDWYVEIIGEDNEYY